MSYRLGTEASGLPLIAAKGPSMKIADESTTEVAIDVSDDTVLPQKSTFSEEQMKQAELKKTDMSSVRKRNGMKVVFRVSFMRINSWQACLLSSGHESHARGAQVRMTSMSLLPTDLHWQISMGHAAMQGLTYTVAHNSKRKQKLQLLKTVTGVIAPAQMTALVCSAYSITLAPLTAVSANWLA